MHVTTMRVNSSDCRQSNVRLLFKWELTGILWVLVRERDTYTEREGDRERGTRSESLNAYEPGRQKSPGTEQFVVTSCSDSGRMTQYVWTVRSALQPSAVRTLQCAPASQLPPRTNDSISPILLYTHAHTHTHTHTHTYTRLITQENWASSIGSSNECLPSRAELLLLKSWACI